MHNPSSRRGGNWPWALTLLVATLMVLFPASPALAGSTICTGTIASQSIFEPETIAGNLVVPAGADCVLVGVVVEGNISVGAGATLTVDAVCHPEFVTLCFGGTVSGNIEAIEADAISLNYTFVEGNVEVRDSGIVSLFRSSIAKNATFDGNDSLSLFDVAIGGNLSCISNEVVDVSTFNSVFGHASGQCAVLSD